MNDSQLRNPGPRSPVTSPIPQTPVLELRQVSKSFGGQAVLRNVTIPLYRGETLVLIGESGCGKSVTLKLLMKLLEPDLGEVRWHGRPVADRSEREITQDRLKIGYLFQGAALFDSLTVYENVAFGLRENLTEASVLNPTSQIRKLKSVGPRISESDIRDIVITRLRDVGLGENVCEKKPAQLSGGMKKRVGLARALALDPDVMLYDEPTTGLDPIMSDVVNELILRTSQNGRMTSLVVTHDMLTVQKVADRVMMLYPLSRLESSVSQVIYEGSADEAFDHPDSRIRQFVRGQAGDRLQELSAA